MLEQPSVLSKAKLAGRWGGVGGRGKGEAPENRIILCILPRGCLTWSAGTPLVLCNSLCILYFWRFFFSCSISKYMLRESPAVISLSFPSLIVTFLFIYRIIHYYVLPTHPPIHPLPISFSSFCQSRVWAMAHVIPGPSGPSCHPWPLMHRFNDTADTYTVLKFLH